MSNAMRSGKRLLAGVAAGALGAGMMIGLAASPAQAAITGVTPGGPLRAVNIATNASADDSTSLTALTTSGIGQTYTFDDSAQSISLVSAPGVVMPTGTVYKLIEAGTITGGVGNGAINAAGVTINGAGLGTYDDSLVVATDSAGNVVVQKTGTQGLVYSDGGAPVAGGTLVKGAMVVATASTSNAIKLWLSAAGTYTFAVGDATATEYTLSVTTTGAPASIDVTPTSLNLPNVAGTSDDVTVSVLDSNGKATQLVGSETLTVRDTDDSLTINGAAGTTGITVVDDSLASGEYDVALAVAGGGVSSSPVTVTVAGGTLLSSLTSKTVSVSMVTTANANAITATAPANAYDADSGSGAKATPYLWQVPTGTTGFTVEATVAPSQTSDKVFFVAYLSTCNAAVADDVLNSGVVTATGGKASFSTSISPAQATSGSVCIVGGGQYIQLTQTAAAAYYAVTPDASVRATATGGTTSFAIQAATQYGTPLSGYTATLTTTVGSRNSSKTVTGTTDATGAVTLDLVDSSTSTTNLTDSVSITVKLGTSSATNTDQSSTTFAATIKYSASGEVSLSQMKFDGTAVADYSGEPVVPFGGTADDSTAIDDTGVIAVTVVASVPGTPVTFTGNEGVLYGASSGAATTVADGKATVTVASNGTTGLATAYVFSTKTGERTVTATSSSGAAVEGKVTYSSAPAAARDITLTADPAKVSTSQASAIKVKVTDVFGNPVTLTGATGGPSVSLQTNLGTLAGGVSIYSVTVTDSNGEASVSATSSLPGTATIKGAASGGQFSNKAGVPFDGAAASVYLASAVVEFSGSPAGKAIVIEGSREKIDGKSYAVVDGNTTGFEQGDKVVPWTKFPGQSSYNEGSGVKSVDADGEFYWKNKTAKKIYVKFKTEDGSVSSNRVIIPAK